LSCPLTRELQPVPPVTTAVSAGPPLPPNAGPLVGLGDVVGLVVGDAVGEDVGDVLGLGDVVGLASADGLGVGVQVGDGEAFGLSRRLPLGLRAGDLPWDRLGVVSVVPCPLGPPCPEEPCPPAALALLAVVGLIKAVRNCPNAKTPATTMTTAPATARVGRSQAMVGPSHRRRPVSPALPRWAQS
jgi:hypothetical protein